MAFILILATSWFWRSWEYIDNWRSNKHLFAAGCANFPESSANYNNLASWYMNHNMWVECITPLLLNNKLTDGTNFNCNYNLAIAYAKTAQFTKSHFYARKALEFSPVSVRDKVQKFVTELEQRMKTISRQEKVLRKYKIL